MVPCEERLRLSRIRNRWNCKQVLEYLDKIALAYMGVKEDWLFAKIGFNLDPVMSRFEGVVRLLHQEQQFRDPSQTRRVLDESRFKVFTQFLRFLANLVTDTDTIGLGRGALHTLFPSMSYLLEEEFWYRCLMMESLAVMGINSEESRQHRALPGSAQVPACAAYN